MGSSCAPSWSHVTTVPDRRAAGPPRPADLWTVSAARPPPARAAPSRPQARPSRPAPSTCRQTWSAPASRCSRTRSAIACSPPTTSACFSRSLPPRGKSSSREALAQPAVPVVRQAGVDLQVPVGALAHDVGVVAEHDRLLDRQQRPLAEHLARRGRVLRRHEVRVGALRPVAGQREHRRPERRQHRAAARRSMPGGEARRGVHRVEVLAHGGERPAVGVPAHALDERRVADAEARARSGRGAAPRAAGRRRWRRPRRGRRCSRCRSPPPGGGSRRGRARRR